ncbi:hypothetical protein D9757_014146 [Collybiopsis confluens]|uniref:Uncharacterized protein n=1 Tax=Collybiopsis confluens TaxID=2823264 RepID=A0A8H5FPT1_9AGAR|nr:hypothetical protein D9757_014146 [Collybiopsis confluens]
MIPSSEGPLEPWSQLTTSVEDSYPPDELHFLDQERPQASFYSIITGRRASFFSNSSQQTVTVSTSLHSSATSLSPSHPTFQRRFLRLKKANSSAYLHAAGPSTSRSATATDPFQQDMSDRANAMLNGIELKPLGVCVSRNSMRLLNVR